MSEVLGFEIGSVEHRQAAWLHAAVCVSEAFSTLSIVDLPAELAERAHQLKEDAYEAAMIDLSLLERAPKLTDSDRYGNSAELYL